MTHIAEKDAGMKAEHDAANAAPTEGRECSTCAGTGLVPWAPFQHRDTDDEDQRCPDCVAHATDRRVPTLQIGSPDVRAGIERLIVHWREQVGDDMDVESKTLRQVCNVLESILEYVEKDVPTCRFCGGELFDEWGELVCKSCDKINGVEPLQGCERCRVMCAPGMACVSSRLGHVNAERPCRPHVRPGPPRPPDMFLACDCATWGEATCPRHGEQAPAWASDYGDADLDPATLDLLAEARKAKSVEGGQS